MKKKELVLFGLCFIIFSSCAHLEKATQTFDESVPMENSSWICPRGGGEIIGYNGIPVSWKIPFFGAVPVIQIPAGDTLLEWNIDNGYYKGKNILFRFNFQPQKQYYFDAGKEDEAYGLYVFEWDCNEKLPWLKGGWDKRGLLGFFPFLNTNQGTILLHSP